MPNGGHEPYCGNRTTSLSLRVDELVTCRDWQAAFPMGDIGFRDALEPGVLYRRNAYSYPPKAVDGFEGLSEIRFDRRWGLFENPTNGWSVQISAWEHDLFPSPGQPLEMQMDEVKVRIVGMPDSEHYELLPLRDDTGDLWRRSSRCSGRAGRKSVGSTRDRAEQ